MDFGRKITQAVSAGTPKAQFVRVFGVGPSTVKCYVSRAERGEDLASLKSPGKRRMVDGTARELFKRDLQ